MLTDRANAICLLRVLHEYSDEKHILPMREIIKRLYSDYGLSLDRRTVYGLVSLLSELGYDISVPEDNGEGYYLKHHLFTADEIRLLMDAVCSFQYLTAKQKENFVSKLQKFLCVYERHRYKHLIISSQKTGHAGYESRQVFRIIGQIDEAIQKKNKVIFAYPHYLVRRGAIRSRKEKHTVIPCGMLCENGHYYLHCKDGKDRHYMYRIDRMKDLEIAESNSKTKETELAKTDEKAVHALAFEPQQVIMKCRLSRLDDIVDQFGTNILVREINDEHIFIEVWLNPVPDRLRRWALQSISFAEVISPQWLRDELKEIVKENPYTEA